MKFLLFLVFCLAVALQGFNLPVFNKNVVPKIDQKNHKKRPNGALNTFKSNRLIKETILWSSTDESSSGGAKTELESQSVRDLVGHKLIVTFTGLDVVDYTFGMEFLENFKVLYKNGMESREPGFWRVIKDGNGKEILEVTQPLTPSFMYVCDVFETSILWRGELDYDSKKVSSGEVITNKKNLGLFPYQETLATFIATILGPEEALPAVSIPRMKDQQFYPPRDFFSPLDMEKYPEIFDSKFIDYFMRVEDALAAGNTPPKRPQPFFHPSSSAVDSEEVAKSEVKERELTGKQRELSRRKRGNKGSKGGF